MAKPSILSGLAAGALAALAFGMPASPAMAAPHIPFEAAPDQGIFLYKVRPGDTMRSIANHYLLRPRDLAVLLNLNRVRDANHLAAGSTVSIPRKLLMVVPARAILTSFRGAVTLNSASPAKVGAVISEGARIETGANSSASFKLEDGSTVTLPSQSVISIDRLRLVLASGELQQVFRLDTGKSQYAVAPNRGPASKFEVRTPVSVSAVRGTEFRVGFDQANTKAVAEVLKDNVAVSGAGTPVLVPQGYGAVAGTAGVGQPIKLLPPPQVLLPIYHHTDGSLVFTIAPIESATHYRLQIAADPGFQDVMSDDTSDKPSINLHGSPVGSFYVRVTAIDANGLEGLPHVYPFTYQPR